MERGNILALAKRFNSVLFEDRGFQRAAVPFMVGGHVVGLLRPDVLPLARAASILHVRDGRVELDSQLETPDQRTSAMAELLDGWRTSEDLVALRGWRDEKYDVRPWFSSPTLMRIERSAASVFGIGQYGVDLNGYVRDPVRGLCVWIQRRSLQKPTWPGKLDNMVSGGLTSGLGVIEAMHKEAWEEAGIPDHLLKSKLKPVGTVSFFYQSERGLFPNTAFVFDMELPEYFVPQPQDGEVEDFQLYPVQELAALICGPEFKTSSAPVTVDFLIRHGFITTDNEPDFLEICELVRVPIQGILRGDRLFNGLSMT